MLESEPTAAKPLNGSLWETNDTITTTTEQWFESIEAVQMALETVTSLEGRLVVSLVMVLLATAIGFVVGPKVVDRTTEFVVQTVRETEAGTVLDAVEELIDVPFPMKAVVRLLQAVVVVVTGLSLLVVWGFADIARDLLSAFASALPHLFRVLLTVGILVGALVGTRYLEQQLEEWLADANYVTAHQEEVVYRVLQVVIFTAAGIAALSLWNVNLGGLLVGAGFLGIVLGMAAQHTLGSLIAGFVLMFSRPFEIGDWVQIDDYEGMVVDITIINTRLRSFDGEIVVLPNDNVSTSTIVNRSKRDRLRLRLEVGVDYETDLDRAEEITIESIENVEDVAPAPKPQVVPTEFGDSAITLECRFWIENPNAHKKWTTIQSVVHEIKTAYDREEIGIPYPQRELSSRTNAGFRIEDGVERNDEAVTYSEPE
ncbi:mechanosensitive ion channel family protein [Natronobacterium gregoryi]|uniref:Mechanosensitive ion channel MscS n=2 Tax=Natronobacterium gregoryi TaxID=44930 RepID=L0AEV8_NATGS|nr:mechanosensitive ion channel family protein [Natronobacterium gregoryi]AFZ71969.1 small-conductance mechanosensitive channel [Natronobacterium gregoryi SP2]ELY62667.1 mechanosensitive ion channel MscS [Natronobacterium gregoryi SP2]PLK20826.1 mechanosensitive ion channel family protein [Natronobacterium gregoryi SP2]SFJ19222.1 Mechanosensitive ion channel [Natronobacterium gregoryi]